MLMHVCILKTNALRTGNHEFRKDVDRHRRDRKEERPEQ